MGLTFQTGALADAIKTDSSNNVGIGGAVDASYKLKVTGATLTTGAATFSSSVTAGGAIETTGAYFLNGNAYFGKASSIFTGGSANDAGIMVSGSNNIIFGNALTERMRINSSGNVGIGTSSPSSTLYIVSGTNTRYATFDGPTAGWCYQDYKYNGTIYGYLGQAASITGGGSNTDMAIVSINNMVFGSGGTTERMRITSGGVLYVGASSIPNSGTIMNVISTNNTDALSRFYLNAASSQSRPAIRVDKYDNTSTTAQVFIDFTINQQTVGNGSITANGASQATFTTWSDARLKENITDLPSQLSNIMALRPCEFDYKDGTGHQIGFIAQEVQEIYPDIINENAEGYLTISGLSKTESRMIKAFQEAVKRIEELEKEVDALKAK